MKSDLSGRKIRVMVVEDHVLVRMGLVAAANAEPDIQVVAEVDNGRQAIEVFQASEVDLVLLDLRMPEGDGIEAIEALRSKFGAVRILVLSSYGDGKDIAQAMQAGASGYIVKGMQLENILEAIRVVYAGEQYLPPEMSSRMAEYSDSGISKRELQVLQFIAKGRTNKEIAAQMGISESTVKAHLTNIFPKLGAADRAQAIAIAIKLQILDVE